MHTQAGHHLGGQVLRTRVCVVGAGPAGLALATRLARHGIEVIVLEAADAAIPVDRLETTRIVGIDYDLEHKRGRGVGGSARLWNLAMAFGGPRLRLRELERQDFQPRPGIRETRWPLAKDDLVDAYAAAWALFDLPGFQQDAPPETGSPAASDGTDPADAATTTDVAATTDVVERLFGMGPASVFTERLPRELAASPVARLVTGAVVTDLRTDGDLGTISAVTCASANGSFTVEASEFVVAGGAVENARLLLAARSGQPAGLGNASGHVGKWFMEHPQLTSALVRPGDQHLNRERALWDVHLRRGVPVILMHSLAAEVIDRDRLLGTAYYLRPRPVTSPVLTTTDGGLDLDRMAVLRTWRTALHARRLPPRLGARIGDAAALAAALGWVGSQALSTHPGRPGPHLLAAPRAMDLRAMCEQVPDARSQVRLTGQRDSFGVPTVELDWRLTDADWLSMTRSQQLIGPYLQTALGVRVDTLLGGALAPRVIGGSHQMGTTRMAASARDGVVDVNCKVFGTSNLYVAGASVFPTVGFANPTLTVVALALRLAEHLRSRSATRDVLSTPDVVSTPDVLSTTAELS